MRDGVKKPIMVSSMQERQLVTAVRHALPYLLGLSLGLSAVPSSANRGSDTSAAFTATQLVRQFTLKNTVVQVSQGMQGLVTEVNGHQRGPGMGASTAGFPGDMGTIPTGINMPQRDGAGRLLGYCAWDNSTTTGTAAHIAGLGVTNQLVYAVVSPGLNGTMQTSCANVLATGTGVGDDYVQVHAPMRVSSASYKTSVATASDLGLAEVGDIRLVRDTNTLFSFDGVSWQAVGGGTGTDSFADDSASNGAGAISYTTGKVTVADFQAAAATFTGALNGTTATFSGAVTGSSFTGNGSGLTDLNASNFTSGTLPVERGGTGISTLASDGQLLIGNGSGFTLGTLTPGAGISVLNSAGAITISNNGVVSITGTANQIIASGSTGAITLSLPQAIATTSTPTFGGMMLNGALTGTTATFSGDLTMNLLLAQRLNVGTLAGDVSEQNLIMGNSAMAGVQSGSGANTAIGISALNANTSGAYNTALGNTALLFNTTGNANTALGEDALFSNTTGFLNTATGASALFSNTIGTQNVGNGYRVLYANTTGGNNAALGSFAGDANTTGMQNTLLGFDADVSTGELIYATAIGAESRVATSNTIALGRNSVADQVVIGSDTRSNTFANTKLYVNGVTNLNGDLRGTTATFTGAVTANSFAGNGSGLTNLNAGNITSGTVPLAYGGTGVSAASVANGRLLIGNGTGFTLANLVAGSGITITNGAGTITISANAGSAGVSSVTGTANQVIVSASTGAVTLSLPQNISTTSTPTFRRLTLSDATGVSNANLVVGLGAMQGSPSGTGGNTALGTNALNANTSGYYNSAVGFNALSGNTTGYYNAAIGANALASNTSGYYNTAIGVGSLRNNIGGDENTANGVNALFSNTSGSFLVAAGKDALYNNTTGFYNTAAGWSALYSNSIGAANSALGSAALYGNTTGDSNVAVGQNAGFATSAGVSTNANTTGSNNTFVGSYAMPGTTTQLSYATALGSAALVTTSNTVVLGRTSDVVVIGATANDASGNKLQVTGSVKATAFNTSSDRRLKNNITELDSVNVLAQLEQLKAYHYRFNSDPTGTVRYGVIAQEVAQLFPHAASYDGKGLMAVDYGALGAIAASGVGYLSTKVNALDEEVKANSDEIAKLDTRMAGAESKLEELDGWKTRAVTQLEDLQAGMEKNMAEIVKNALLIAGNTQKIESLEALTEKMGGRLDLSEKSLADLRARLDASVQLSADGSTLNVMTPNLVAGNFSSQSARIDSLYSARLEAEMARISELEVNNLRANTSVANTVQADQMNTGSMQLFAGAGLPALLFAAKEDGHYIVNTSALDGSYAMATVIVNAGQARVFVAESEGIELFAQGNMIKALAAGKSIKASWIKMG